MHIPKASYGEYDTPRVILIQLCKLIECIRTFLSLRFVPKFTTFC